MDTSASWGPRVPSPAISDRVAGGQPATQSCQGSGRQRGTGVPRLFGALTGQGPQPERERRVHRLAFWAASPASCPKENRMKASSRRQTNRHAARSRQHCEKRQNAQFCTQTHKVPDIYGGFQLAGRRHVALNIYAVQRHKGHLLLISSKAATDKPSQPNMGKEALLRQPKWVAWAPRVLKASLLSSLATFQEFQAPLSRRASIDTSHRSGNRMEARTMSTYPKGHSLMRSSKALSCNMTFEGSKLSIYLPRHAPLRQPQRKTGANWPKGQSMEPRLRL